MGGEGEEKMRMNKETMKNRMDWGKRSVAKRFNVSTVESISLLLTVVLGKAQTPLLKVLLFLVSEQN